MHQWLLGLLGWQTHVNDTANAFLFPGVVPLTLAVGGLWWSLRAATATATTATTATTASAVSTSTAAGAPGASVSRYGERSRHAARVHPIAPYWVMGIVAVFVAMGPPLGVWPYVYWLPGLNFVRVPSRFMLLTMLCLGVVAAWGFERLSARLSPWRRGWAAVGVGALLVAEFAMTPLAVEPYAVDIPAIDRWLGAQPVPFAVAEVPLPSPANLGGWERAETTYMLHSLAHYQPTVHGYSGHRPAFHEGLYHALLTFPDRESLDILTGIGVRYIVVHTDLYEPGEWPDVEARLDTWRARLRLVHVEGAGRAYELLPVSR